MSDMLSVARGTRQSSASSTMRTIGRPSASSFANSASAPTGPAASIVLRSPGWSTTKRGRFATAIIDRITWVLPVPAGPVRSARRSQGSAASMSCSDVIDFPQRLRRVVLASQRPACGADLREVDTLAIGLEHVDPAPVPIEGRPEPRAEFLAKPLDLPFIDGNDVKRVIPARVDFDVSGRMHQHDVRVDVPSPVPVERIRGRRAARVSDTEKPEADAAQLLHQVRQRDSQLAARRELVARDAAHIGQQDELEQGEVAETGGDTSATPREPGAVRGPLRRQGAGELSRGGHLLCDDRIDRSHGKGAASSSRPRVGVMR